MFGFLLRIAHSAQKLGGVKTALFLLSKTRTATDDGSGNLFCTWQTDYHHIRFALANCQWGITIPKPYKNPSERKIKPHRGTHE